MSFGKYDPRSLGLASQTWQEDFAMKGLLEIVEEINKIKPETTRNLKAMFGSMERMGRANMLQPIQSAMGMPQRQLSNQIGFGIQQALMPTTLLMNQMVNQVSNAIIPFINENRLGAGLGGMVGFVAGFGLPGGPMLWSLIGTGVGAGLQALNDIVPGVTDVWEQIPGVIDWFQESLVTGLDAIMNVINPPPPDLTYGDMSGMPLRTSGRLPL